MSVSALIEAKQAWASAYVGLSQEEINSRVRGFTVMVRAIAESGFLTPETFAERMDLEPAQAAELFAGLDAFGMQFDDAGNIVGAALTALETPHKVRVVGKQLYAWCALDTLFIPGLLGDTADIESRCPSSGDAVRLTVSSEEVETAEPSSTWLSVFLPGASSRQLGPASPT